MAIIYSYPTLANLSAEDLLLVSDVSSVGKQTKNITVQQVVDLVPNIVPGGGTLTSVTLDFGSTGLLSSGNVSQTINTGVPGTFTVTGTLAQGFGGTGLSTYSAGDIIYANNSSSLVRLARGTTGQVLQLTGVAGSELPAWGSAGGAGTVTSIGLATTMAGLSWTVAAGQSNPTTSAATFTLAGTLGLANGGTNANSQQGALDEITAASSGTAGQILTTNGANASWGDFSTGVTSINFGTTGLTPPTSTPGTGAVTVAGTLIAANGGTGISSTLAVGNMLYASSTSAYSLLPIGSTGQVLKVTAGIPAWETDIAYSVAALDTASLSSAVILNNTGGSSTRVDLVANTTTVTNTDLDIKGSSTTNDINIFHKDIFTAAGGAAGQYVGVKNITVSSSGHITAAVAEKFVGQRPVGPGKETAGFQSDSGAEVLLLPFSSTLTGKPGQFNFTIINNTGAATSGVQIRVALYTGLLGDTVSSSNLLVTQGSTTNAGTAFTAPFVKGADVNDNFEAAYSTGLAMDGNYILAVQIPQFIRLLSISQDGDQKAGGCLCTGLDLASAPNNLNGVSLTTRVSGSPIKIPAWNLTDPVVS